MGGQGYGPADKRVCLLDQLARLEHGHVTLSRLGRLQRAELRHLRRKICIRLRVERILRGHLGDEEFQKIVLGQRAAWRLRA